MYNPTPRTLASTAVTTPAVPSASVSRSGATRQRSRRKPLHGAAREDAAQNCAAEVGRVREDAQRPQRQDPLRNRGGGDARDGRGSHAASASSGGHDGHGSGSDGAQNWPTGNPPPPRPKSPVGGGSGGASRRLCGVRHGCANSGGGHDWGGAGDASHGGPLKAGWQPRSLCRWPLAGPSERARARLH